MPLNFPASVPVAASTDRPWWPTQFILQLLFLITLGLALASSSAWSQAAADETLLPVAALRADASPAEQAEAIDDMVDWLRRDFEQARGPATAWIENPALAPELRSQLLRAAIEAARRTAALDFEAVAGPVFEELAERLPSGSERSQLKQSYANLALSRGRFDQAEALYRQAMADETDRDIASRANLRTALGVALAQQGKLDDALASMLESYRLYEQTEAGPTTDLLRNIGGLSIYLRDWEQAVNFSQLAIERLGADNPATAGIYSNLGAALIEQGKLSEAIAALETGIAVGEASGQPAASAISNLGFVLRELGRHEDALQQFERAAAINRSMSDVGSLGVSLKNIGETLILLGRRDDADVALHASMEAFHEADIKPKRLELYPVLVENLEQLGRLPEALAMMREYRELSAELASAEAQTRVAELQTAFDLERRERELAESERERLAGEAELATLHAEQSRQKLIGQLLLAGVLVLGLFLLVLLRSLRLRNRANRLLAEKNSEIDVQRKRLSETNQRLKRQSIEDELTGLGNRRSLRLTLESALPPALTRTPSLLVLIDLDRFKEINDRYGHPVGDAVLKRFAGLLRDHAGPDDLLARWGGEEFLWLIAGARVERAAERCRAFVEHLRDIDFELEDQPLAISCSMGATALDLNAASPQAAFDLAIKIADAALYEAKAAGRDQWVVLERPTETRESFEGSLDLEALLETGALKRVEGAGH